MFWCRVVEITWPTVGRGLADGGTKAAADDQSEDFEGRPALAVLERARYRVDPLPIYYYYMVGPTFRFVSFRFKSCGDV